GAVKEEKGAKQKRERGDKVMELIKATLAPGSWSEQGGPGTIDYYPLSLALVVNQTAEVHEQIAELLQALRRLQDVQIVLEIRLVSLGEGTCERVGLDFQTEGKDEPVKAAFLNDKQLFAFLEAVQGNRPTNIMPAPKLTTLNGQKATVQVMDRQPFVTGVEVASCGGSIVFVPKNETIPLGLQMTVQPVAAADRRSIKVSLSARLTELGGGTGPLAPVPAPITSVGEGPRETVPFHPDIPMPR